MYLKVSIYYFFCCKFRKIYIPVGWTALIIPLKARSSSHCQLSQLQPSSAPANTRTQLLGYNECEGEHLQQVYLSLLLMPAIYDLQLQKIFNSDLLLDFWFTCDNLLNKVVLQTVYDLEICQCPAWANCRKCVFQFWYLKKQIKLFPFVYAQAYQCFAPIHNK